MAVRCVDRLNSSPQGRGGGAHAADVATLHAVDCEFSGGRAMWGGGIGASESTNVTLAGTTFTGNEVNATGEAGATRSTYLRHGSCVTTVSFRCA